jgi:hypothetical protein
MTQIKKKAASHGVMLPSRQAAMQVLDSLRRQQNEQLLGILEEEQVMRVHGCVYVCACACVCATDGLRLSCEV